MFLGICLGISAALFQTGGYIFSRISVKQGMTPFQIWVSSQTIMGALGLLLLPFVWRNEVLSDNSLFWPFLGCFSGNLIGQYFFYRAEESIAPSRISSLIGLRVVTLAIAMALFGMETYDWVQVLAIILAVASAAVMNYQNGGFQWQGMGSLALMFVFLLFSDISIKHFINGLDPGAMFQASLLAMSLVFASGGICLLPFAFKISRSQYKAITPYSICWFLKQFFLYSCFAAIGPVFGNIVMSSRGPLAIILTLILLHLGVHHLETPKGVSVWVRRSIATLMMLTAIVLYSLASM